MQAGALASEIVLPLAGASPSETMERNQPRTSPIRLLVFDAHPLVRWALSQIARHAGDIESVGEAASAAEATAIAYSLQPDVVTIDCSGAEGEGWALAAALRNAYQHTGIVILAADASDQMLFRALNLGASAFVSKSAPIPDLLATIRHSAASPQSFTAAGLAEALRRRGQRTERLALSPREQEILILLHDGLSVPAVAAQLYVSLSTAKTYVARLYEKLGAKNRSQALMTAVRLGLLEEQFTAVS